MGPRPGSFRPMQTWCSHPFSACRLRRRRSCAQSMLSMPLRQQLRAERVQPSEQCHSRRQCYLYECPVGRPLTTIIPQCILSSLAGLLTIINHHFWPINNHYLPVDWWSLAITMMLSHIDEIRNGWHAWPELSPCRFGSHIFSINGSRRLWSWYPGVCGSLCLGQVVGTL